MREMGGTNALINMAMTSKGLTLRKGGRLGGYNDKSQKCRSPNLCKS